MVMMAMITMMSLPGKKDSIYTFQGTYFIRHEVCVTFKPNLNSENSNTEEHIGKPSKHIFCIL
jgi:hypothetical protein